MLLRRMEMKTLKRMAEVAGVKDWRKLAEEVKRLDGLMLKSVYDWLHLPSDQRFPKEG